jgi:hypothetical protein
LSQPSEREDKINSTVQEKLAIMEVKGIKVTHNCAEIGKLFRSVLQSA